jgi:ribonuclease PH
VLVECGQTKVLCTANVAEQSPHWNAGKAWLTAEYSMLPGSTETRKSRDGRTARVDGRAYEIQRIIGRSLRSMIDFTILPELTIWVDCDVLSADGGTRTAAINGAAIALFDACLWLEERRMVRQSPLRQLISAVSVGIVKGTPIVDLDYQEDAQAEVDMNVVCAADGRFVEVQSTAEKSPFDGDQLQTMLGLAKAACHEIHQKQKEALRL